VKIPTYRKAMIRALGAFHAWLYRAMGGGGPFNKNTLVLTTRGRKTGREVSTPLLYVSDRDRLYVVASFGGSDVPPTWYQNLTANPAVTVEVGSSRRRYRARTLTTEEAAPIWPRLLEIWPAYATYQTRTTRVIPVVELSPV